MLLSDPNEYYYIARSRNNKGGLDCVWGYKIALGIPRRKVYTVNNIWTWYANKKTRRGWIRNIDDLQPGDIIFSIDSSDPNYESQYKIRKIDGVKKGHVGIVVLFDFEDGLGERLAVFQCCSIRLTEEKWTALFYGDTGPNITALISNDGKSNWRFYVRPNNNCR